MIDESCGVGSLGTDRVAGQDQLSGEVEGQRIGRTKQRRTSRKDADRDLWQPEACRTRRDHEIAREYDLEPATQCRALDGGDQRLAPHATNDAVFASALGDIISIAGEITARAENRAASFEYAGPERIIVIELICVWLPDAWK